VCKYSSFKNANAPQATSLSKLETEPTFAQTSLSNESDDTSFRAHRFRQFRLQSVELTFAA